MASACGEVGTRPTASSAADSLVGSSAWARCSRARALPVSGTPSQARAKPTREDVRVAGASSQPCSARSTISADCTLSVARAKKPGIDWISAGRSAAAVSWISERSGSTDSPARFSATSNWIR